MIVATFSFKMFINIIIDVVNDKIEVSGFKTTRYHVPFPICYRDVGKEERNFRFHQNKQILHVKILLIILCI